MPIYTIANVISLYALTKCMYNLPVKTEATFSPKFFGTFA